MQYITTLNGRQFEVVSSVPLTMEQVNSYAAQKMQASGCTACGSAAQARQAAGSGGIMKLGTATCPTTALALNSTHSLNGSVVNGGTAPFTYNWTINPPTGTTVTLSGQNQSYQFTQAGQYGITMTVIDSCSGGARSDTATCIVTVAGAVCTNPACAFTMS